MGNGATTTYTYHPQNLRLTNLTTSGNIQNLSYQYDAVGNVKTITDTKRSQVSTFNYDDLNRMTSFNLSGAAPEAHTWSYNAIGNITQHVVNGAPQNYTYDPFRLHAVTAVGTSTYVYDANGNMTNRAGAIMVYDEENRLSQMTETNGTVTTYTYDGAGQRAKKVVTSGGNTTTTLYVGNYFEKVTQTGDITKYYYFGSQRVAVKQSGTLFYLHTDPLGSISVTTNQSGRRRARSPTCRSAKSAPARVMSRRITRSQVNGLKRRMDCCIMGHGITMRKLGALSSQTISSRTFTTRNR
ncbi:MAG: RHS repeat protein [Chloroflexi bacterium]|nr:RHS repeat protein [Chloroflexota bacterium]